MARHGSPRPGCTCAASVEQLPLIRKPGTISGPVGRYSDVPFALVVERDTSAIDRPDIRGIGDQIAFGIINGHAPPARIERLSRQTVAAIARRARQASVRAPSSRASPLPAARAARPRDHRASANRSPSSHSRAGRPQAVADRAIAEPARVRPRAPPSPTISRPPG